MRLDCIWDSKEMLFNYIFILWRHSMLFKSKSKTLCFTHDWKQLRIMKHTLSVCWLAVPDKWCNRKRKRPRHKKRTQEIYLVQIFLSKAGKYSGIIHEIINPRKNISFLPVKVLLYLTLSWQRWTGFHMIKASVMKELMAPIHFTNAESTMRRVI